MQTASNDVFAPIIYTPWKNDIKDDDSPIDVLLIFPENTFTNILVMEPFACSTDNSFLAR